MTRRRSPSANAGSPSSRPAHRHCQDRSINVTSASSSTSWPLPGITAATQSSVPASAFPGARSAASTPGSATCRRSPGSSYSSSSVRRAHRLVVTTEAAAESTAPSRARVSPSAGSWPSGMCTSVTSRNLLAWGTNTSGAVEATRPSSSTTASSGIPWMTPARAVYDAASGRGQEPGTAYSRTDQPVSASPRQTRRS